MLNHFKGYTRYSHFDLYPGFGFTQVAEINCGPRIHVCPTEPIPSMPADAMATFRARASASMVLTSKAGVFRLQHKN